MSSTTPPASLPAIVHLPAAKDHFTQGRDGQRPEWAVIHNTVGVDSRAWLSRTSSPPVSIHTLVMRDGTLVEIVPPGSTAWHVGTTRPGCGVDNLNSLGLELESLNDVGVTGNGYTPAQVAAAAYRVATWCVSYGLDPCSAIISHASVAWPEGRRHDPYGFDWPPFLAQVRAWVAFFHSLPVADLPRWII